MKKRSYIFVAIFLMRSLFTGLAANAAVVIAPNSYYIFKKYIDEPSHNQQAEI